MTVEAARHYAGELFYQMEKNISLENSLEIQEIIKA